MLRYVTTNPGKVREAREYLDDGSVSQLDVDYAEIQSADLGPLAARGAREWESARSDPGGSGESDGTAAGDPDRHE